MSVVTLVFVSAAVASTVLICWAVSRRPEVAAVRPTASTSAVAAPAVSALVSASVSTSVSAAPVAPAGRADRPLRAVPQLEDVSDHDVETELRCGGLSAADVRLVTARAQVLGMGSFTMWQAIEAYGVAELAVAVAGDLPCDALLQHLVDGTAPDFAELAVFAALNGLETTLPASRVRGASVRQIGSVQRPAAPRRLDIAGLDIAGLEIHEPGSWPQAA